MWRFEAEVTEHAGLMASCSSAFSTVSMEAMDCLNAGEVMMGLKNEGLYIQFINLYAERAYSNHQQLVETVWQ